VRPVVQATSNEASAKMMRELHPLRAERWSISDANPWFAWLDPWPKRYASSVQHWRARRCRGRPRKPCPS